MVPSAIVMLEALPMNTNGKVDRAALPAPDESIADYGYVAPRNPSEALLTGIWADVLGLQQVGIHDNFFELGGHSLLATQLISRVQDGFTVELPLRRLFESPTVAGLMEHIEAARREGQDRVATHRAGFESRRTLPVFCPGEALVPQPAGTRQPLL